MKAKQEKKTRYNKTRQKPSYQGWTRLPSRRKRVSRADKRLRDTHFHCLESYIADSANVYIEDLVQMLAVLVLVPSVSVRPYEICFVDSVGHVLLMSSIPSDSYNLFSSSSSSFPKL